MWLGRSRATPTCHQVRACLFPCQVPHPGVQLTLPGACAGQYSFVVPCSDPVLSRIDMPNGMEGPIGEALLLAVLLQHRTSSL